MKKADASGARYAVLVGEDEVAAAALTVKPLREQAPQARVTLAEAIDLVRGANNTQSESR
jgi:histidyl-tRNA synthetase